MRFSAVGLPSEGAEPLPKAPIRRKFLGARIHASLQILPRAWMETAPSAAFGHRQRWLATCRTVYAAGRPLKDGPGYWRLGEITMAWAAVAP